MLCPPVDGAVKPAVAKPESKKQPYRSLPGTRSRATRNMAWGRDKTTTRFPSIMISNTNEGFRMKNMEVMSKTFATLSNTGNSEGPPGVGTPNS